MSDATPIYTALAEQTWACGIVGHDRQVWENEEEGILYCLDCGRNSFVESPEDR